jgi:integrase
VLDPAEARALLDSIDTDTVAGLRDRTLIALMVYSFARIGAALGMAVEDVYTQNRRVWVRLHEKGGKRHTMPCHHNLEEYLVAYVDTAGLRDDPKGRCSARSAAAPAGSPALCCRRRTLRDDPPSGRGGRDRNQAWQSQLPGNRDHRLPEERRHS